jgi:hypothetical protein
MPLRAIRYVVIAVCAAGIVGMIVASVAGNNNGAVITFGLLTAVSILVLMAFSAATRQVPERTTADESLALQIEGRVQGLVEAGADERAVRELVGDAVRLGRGTKR